MPDSFLWIERPGGVQVLQDLFNPLPCSRLIEFSDAKSDEHLADVVFLSLRVQLSG